MGSARTENEIATIVVNTAFEVHVRLGPGLLKSVYEAVLHHELLKLDVKVGRQIALPSGI